MFIRTDQWHNSPHEDVKHNKCINPIGRDDKRSLFARNCFIITSSGTLCQKQVKLQRWRQTDRPTDELISSSFKAPSTVRGMGLISWSYAASNAIVLNATHKRVTWFTLYTKLSTCITRTGIMERTNKNLQIRAVYSNSWKCLKQNNLYTVSIG